MEQPPVGVMPKKKNAWRFTPLLILALIVGGIFAYQAFGANQLTQALPEGDSAIAFSDTGLMEKFLLSHYSLLAQPRPHAGDAVILESVQLPDGTGNAVLASMPNTSGTVLGILHGNGNFEPLLSDGTQKVDLHVLSGGLVVYSVLSNPVVWEPVQKESVNTGPDTDVEISEGHATGPVESGVDYKSAGSGSVLSAVAGGMLYAFDVLKDTVPRSLGAGKSPRVSADGSLVALTSDGIERVTVATGAHAVLFAFKGGDAAGSTISEDGSVALLHSAGNSVSGVYRISGNKVTSAGSIVSTVPTYGASFADTTHLFLRTDKTSVALYRLPDDTASLKPPTAHLSIIAPQ